MKKALIIFISASILFFLSFSFNWEKTHRYLFGKTLLTEEMEQFDTLDVNNSFGNYKIESEDEEWILNQSSLADVGVINRFKQLLFETNIIREFKYKNERDLEQYGLYPQKFIIKVTSKGKEFEIKIGDPNPAGTGYYSQLSWRKDVVSLISRSDLFQMIEYGEMGQWEDRRLLYYSNKLDLKNAKISLNDLNENIIVDFENDKVFCVEENSNHERLSNVSPNDLISTFRKMQYQYEVSEAPSSYNLDYPILTIELKNKIGLIVKKVLLSTQGNSYYCQIIQKGRPQNPLTVTNPRFDIVQTLHNVCPVSPSSP